jgi:GntR family transcriptional regulator/MocR family aminotransferase
VAAKRVVDGFGPVLLQETLASFIAEGHLARHIRRMRRIYGERHDTLVAALGKYCAPWLTPIPAMAGVHLAAELSASAAAWQIVARAAQAGIRLERLDAHAHRKPARGGLIFGYGLIRAHDINPAIRTLARLLHDRKQSR